SAAYRRYDLVPDRLRGVLRVENPDQAPLGKDTEHGRVAGQHPKIPVKGLGDHHPGLTGPHIAVRHDHLNPESHCRSSSCAWRSTSAIPPVMKNAGSGSWSYLPSVIALKEATVSDSGTNTPGWPVNCSATNIGWDRNRSIRRARLTASWSSSDSSSTPRMAMMSCSS